MAATRPIASEPRPLSTSMQVLFIVVALIMVLVLAGLPDPGRTAGDGSENLRHGWAKRQTLQAAESTAEPTADAAR